MKWKKSKDNYIPIEKGDEETIEMLNATISGMKEEISFLKSMKSENKLSKIAFSYKYLKMKKFCKVKILGYQTLKILCFLPIAYEFEFELLPFKAFVVIIFFLSYIKWLKSVYLSEVSIEGKIKTLKNDIDGTLRCIDYMSDDF